MNNLRDVDIEVFTAIEEEKNRQKNHLELIASENFERVINIIPTHRFFPIFSLKISKAMKLVATISKLLINDIELLGELEIDNRSIIGAIISRTIIPKIYFKSFFVIFS